MNKPPYFTRNIDGKSFKVVLPRRPAFALAAAALVLFSPLSFAVGECKGQAQDACNSDNSCSWINSYTTKNGKSINAYCRNKSKPGNSKAVPESSTKAKPDNKG